MTRPKLSIAVIVIVVLVTGTTLLLTAFGVLSYRAERELRREELLQAQQVLADQLKEGLALPVWNFDHEQVDRILQGAMKEESVAGIVVRLSDVNSTLYSYDRDPAWKLRKLMQEFPGDGLALERRWIEANHEILGSVKVFATDRFVEASLRKTRLSMLALVVTLEVVLVLGLYFMLWQTVLRPLKEVEQYALAVRSGDGGEALLGGRRYRGELENLRASIQTMVALLRSRVTDLQSSEQALRVSERRLRDAQRIGRIGHWELNLATDELSWSEEVYRIFELPTPIVEPLHQEFWKRVYPADREKLKSLHLESVRTATPYDATHRLLLPDGRIKYVHEHCVTYCDASGKPDHCLGTVQDVTETRKMEETLRASEERYRLLVENSSELVCEVLVDGRFIYANANYRVLLGFEPAELLGKNALEMVHPEDLPEVARKFQNSEGEAIFRHRHKDGSWRWLESSGRRYATSSGEDHGVIISRDITERKKAEAALQSSEQRFREIFDNTTDSVFLIEVLPEGKFRYEEFNPASARVTGLSNETVRGRAVEEVIPQPLAAQLLANYTRCWREGQPIRYEEEIAFPGGLYNFDTFLVPIRNAEGVIYRIAGFARDVTQQRQAERQRASLETQLRQAQKMESIGTLAGGIAHDFNNILGAIMAFTDLALMEIADQNLVRGHLNQVLKASDRAKDLVRQILMFSRQQLQEQRPCRLQPIIQDALKLLRSTVSASVEIQADIHDDAPVVLADSGQIHQVVLNLCANAAHAMRGRPGKLRVALEARRVEGEFAQAHLELPPDTYAVLTISDTGHGMDADTLKRIFDPFFTTKAPGEGTGLGLAVVHGIVKEHDGVITVQSEPGIGTTFQLFFPADTSAAPALLPAENPRTTPQTGAGQRILVVDDEGALGRAMQRILQRQGYRVTAESSPEKALELFRATPEAFDLVIVDLNMPVIPGPELATQLLQISPRLPILLATGYSGAWTPEKVLAHGLRGLVLKPFDTSELSRAVHDALQSPAPAHPG